VESIDYRSVGAPHDDDDDLSTGARDRRCVRCGYSLIGHTDDGGRCPECGLPVYWSTHAPEKLSQYPANWVSAMASGTGLLFIAYGTAFALGVAVAQQWLSDRNLTEIAVAGVLISVLQLAGMWQLSRSSGHWTEPSSPVLRRMLRVSPVGPLVGSALLLIGYYGDLLPLTCMVGVLGPTAVFVRLRTVARLISDRALAEHSAIVGWGFFASLVVVPLVIFFVGSSMRSVPSALQLIFAVLLFLGWMLFLIWGAFIMLCCLVDFTRAAKVANAAWAATRGDAEA
jgi:hypothetical protein